MSKMKLIHLSEITTPEEYKKFLTMLKQKYPKIYRAWQKNEETLKDELKPRKAEEEEIENRTNLGEEEAKEEAREKLPALYNIIKNEIEKDTQQKLPEKTPIGIYIYIQLNEKEVYENMYGLLNITIMRNKILKKLEKAISKTEKTQTTKP
jgi:hypothetical protein